MKGIAPSPELATSTVEVDLSAWNQVFVVGDVHGCAQELRTLLSRLRPDSNDLVLFAGDLVRKGPASDDVVDIVRANQNYKSVCGNNEAKVINGYVSVDELSAEDIEWLETLPNAFRWETGLLVHGGVNPRADTQTPSTVRCVRSLAENPGYGNSPYWWQLHEMPPRVFFGHTVFSDPFITHRAVGIDTGCVYGGALSAINIRTGEVTQVESNGVYQERADSAILNPGNVVRNN